MSLAILLVLVGPLLLFNPWFTSALQQRHDVAEAFGTRQSAVDRVTGEILADVFLDGDFDASLEPGEPLLDERERSHMHDVSLLARILLAVVLLAAVTAGISLAWLRREPRRQGRILLVAGGLVGTAAVLVAGFFAVAFETAFRIFHEIFFPPGTWLFQSGSNLITLFPEGFWFDAALAAGAAIILAALIVVVIGLRRWRGGPPAAASA